MKISKKIIALVLLFAVAFTFFAVSPTKSRMKSYYSGDAISFNNKVYIGSVNTGKLELFTVENDSLYRKHAIVSTDAISKTFYDLKFVKENGKLYVYAVNGRYLYKYDITKINTPVITLKIKDNSWDWFSRVDVVDGKLITVGSKGIKVWNKDHQVIDSYTMIESKDAGAISFSGSKNFTVRQDDKINIFSTASRSKIAEAKIVIKDNLARKIVLNDEKTNMVYIADDESLKAINLSGKIVREFKHTSNVAYNVVEATNSNYIYFSDGVGVVKLRKNDLQVMDWKYTTRLGISGSWAMGIKAVSNGIKENLVVFNGSNILVLDENMEAITHYQSTEKEERPMEDLFLGMDKHKASASAKVSLRGAGFGLNEELEIKILRTKTTAKADSNGRFKQVITIPSSFPTKTDIKVTGKESGRTYSIGFEIQ